jgi:formylglycine-generating enzyme required for sulfatase activity
MGETEVTQEQWRRVMGANPSYYTGPYGRENPDNRPVENISWDEAVEFCNALSRLEHKTPVYTVNNSTVTPNWNADGYRLPTEMEWVWAAIGADTLAPGQLNSKGYMKIFSGTGLRDNCGWFGLTLLDAKTFEVKKKSRNEVNLYDMTGNVWEWCWDWHSSLPARNLVDYQGPGTGNNRIAKGGGFGDSDGTIFPAYRNFSLNPAQKKNDVGLRIVYRD